MTFSQGVWLSGGLFLTAWVLPLIFPSPVDPLFIYTPVMHSSAGLLCLFLFFAYFKQGEGDGSEFMNRSYDEHSQEENLYFLVLWLYILFGVVLGITITYDGANIKNIGMASICPSVIVLTAIVYFFSANPQEPKLSFAPGIFGSGVVSFFAWLLPALMGVSGVPLGFFFPTAIASFSLLVMMSGALFVRARWHPGDGLVNQLRRSTRFAMLFFIGSNMLAVGAGIYVTIVFEDTKHKWACVVMPILVSMSSFIYFFFAKPHAIRARA